MEKEFDLDINDLTTEQDTLSVDDILAEFQLEEEEKQPRRPEDFDVWLEGLEEAEEEEEPLPPAREEEPEAYRLEEILTEESYGPEDGEAGEPEDVYGEEPYGEEAYEEEAYEEEAYEEKPYEPPMSRIALMEQEARALLLDEEEEPAEEQTEETPLEPQFHEDFYMGEDRSSSYYRYEDQELDTSPDENYQAPVRSESPSTWAPGEEEAGFGKKEKKGLRLPFGRKKKKQAEAEEPGGEEKPYTEGFDDLYTAPGEYAPERDYDFAEPEDEGIREEDTFPSFRECVLGLLFGLLFKLRGLRILGEGRVLEEANEDLGTEMSPAAASKYYGSHVHAMRLRLRISLVLLAVMLWVTCGLMLPGALKMLEVRAAMLMACQLTILLLGLDSATGALLNIARRRFGADSLAVIACLVTSIDALGVAKGLFGDPHLPLCLLSALSFLGVMLSSFLSARSMRKAMRVPAIGKQCFAVTGELGVKGKSTDITLLKSVRSSKGFVHRAEEMPPDEETFLKASPFLLLFALLFAIVACAAKAGFQNFFYSFSSVLVAAAPITALLGFALPYFVGTCRIFHSGAAIAGWAGVCDIGQSKNMIVTDRDIFPESAIEIANVRVFADEKPQRIIAYAGTMVIASGSSCGASFGKLMEKYKCSMAQVTDFQVLSGGGMKGIIDGHVVLCGSTDLMRLMNVKLPFRLVGKDSVLLAIDGILYGIFTMKYEARPHVRQALVSLIRSNRHPIFATRDFNVNPELIQQSFDIPTDGYDFPPYADRFAMTEAAPGEDSLIAGVVCLEGLGPLTHMTDTGRSIYVATRINVYISLLAAILGMLVVFVKLLLAGSIGAGFLIAFALLWALPVVAISLFLRF